VATEGEVFESFRAAADKARELARERRQGFSVRRAPNGWAVVGSETATSNLRHLTTSERQGSTPVLVPASQQPQMDQSYGVPERLLYAIKAFYLGHAISERAAVLNDATRLIKEALLHFHSAESEHDRVAKCFYLMLQAEIERHSGRPPVDVRASIRETDDECYELFMRLEEATENRARLEGISSAVIVHPAIERTGFHVHSNGFQSWSIAYDKALKAFGLRESDLSADQQLFLSKATLVELLERHGVRAAP